MTQAAEAFEDQPWPADEHPPKTPAKPAGPRSFDEVFSKMAMSPAEEEAADEPPDEEGASALERAAENPQDPDALPDWVTLPEKLKIPPGKQIAFMRFRAAWTDKPQKGDRWCMVWPLSDVEEKIALKRTRGEAIRTFLELSKQTIRVIDGKMADWTGDPRKTGGISVERFWDEIGPKCRQLIQNYYHKTHALDMQEQADFFVNCLVVKTAVVG